MNNTIEQEIEKLENAYISVLQQQQFVAPHILENVLQEYKNLKAHTKSKELPDFLQEKGIINSNQHRFVVKKLRDVVKNDQVVSNAAVKKKSYKSYGPYRILERVASGAMGVIYKAEDTRDGAVVALKIIRDGADAKKMRKQRFDREARSAQKIQSPGVVSIRDAGEINGIPYLSMDFVEGSTLDEYWEESETKDINDAVRIGAAIARALAHTHKAGIIHRDIKPANILMDCTTNPPIPLITDFSLAMITDPLEQKLTQTGVAVGTPYYMSPEQTLGIREDIGPHTDTYSLGAVLYEMLCSNPPFKAKSIRELYHKIQKQQPFPLTKKNPDIPVILEKIIFKALEKKPHQRFKTCDEFADAMDKYLRNEPVDLDKPSLKVQINHFISNNKQVLRLIAVAIMISIIGITSFMLLSSESKDNPLVDRKAIDPKIKIQFAEKIAIAEKQVLFETLDETQNEYNFKMALQNTNEALEVYSPPLSVENIVWQANESWQKNDARDFWQQATNWQQLPISEFLIAIQKSNKQDYYLQSFSYLHVGYISKALKTIKNMENKDVLSRVLEARLEWLTGNDYKGAHEALGNENNLILNDNKSQFPLLLLAKNKVVEAHSLAHQLVKEHPENPLWKLTLGIIYKEIGQLELAKDLLDKITAPQEIKSAALYYRGLCLKKQARYEEAIQSFESILIHTPISPNAFYELMVCSFEVKKNVQNYLSLYAFQNLMQISHNLNYEQATFIYEKLNLKENSFSALVRTESDTSGFYYLKGLMILSQLNKSREDTYREALRYFDKALDLDPANYKIAVKAAEINERLKRFDKALNLYSHAFWCAPDWEKRKNIYNDWMALAFKQRKYWHLGEFIDLFDREMFVSDKAKGFQKNWIDLCEKANQELVNVSAQNKLLQLQKDAIRYFLGNISNRELIILIDEIPEESEEIAFLKSLLFYMAKDYQKALNSLNLANNNDDEVSFLKARILSAQNQTLESSYNYQQIREKNPIYQQRTSYIIGINRLANNLKSSEKFDEAIKILEKTLEQTDNNALQEKSKGYFLLGELYELKGDSQRALDNYSLSLKKNANWVTPYLKIAEVYENNQDLTRALVYYRFADSLEDTDSITQNYDIDEKIKRLEQRVQEQEHK